MNRNYRRARRRARKFIEETSQEELSLELMQRCYRIKKELYFQKSFDNPEKIRYQRVSSKSGLAEERIRQARKEEKRPEGREILNFIKTKIKSAY